MTEAFVDLNRRFAQFDKHSVGEDVIAKSYTESLFFSHSTISWADLLKERLAVVLGEPGSGKTVEFRNRASVIQQSGEFAFFIPLERLVNESLGAVLSESDENRFEVWLQSGRKATFLLDSVDESKIRQSRDFESALQRFAKDITAVGIERATLILSSRVSEWRAAADSALIQRVFRVRDEEERRDTEASNGAQKDLQVVRLLPLGKEMVVRLLGGAQFERVPEITEAFDRCFLWPFLRRPMDALQYARSVRDDTDLSSLTSVLSHDIDERLRETREREGNDILTPAEADEGATTLAAAAIFTRRSTFLVHGTESDEVGAALDAAKCLPSGWTAEKVNLLLNRAVFDGASRGMIRFHHRTVTEFLAAKWLCQRAEQGCPIPNIEDLLCDRQPGGRVIREGFQPVVAWIACGDSNLSARARAWVLEAAPDLFFAHGDPAALPSDYRRELLEAYIDRFAKRQALWTDTDPESLARFGDTSHAPVLIRTAMDESGGVDSRLLALWIMRHAQIVGCVETAIALAVDKKQSLDIRITAAAVVRDVGNTEQRQKFAEQALGLTQIPGKLLGIFVECIFPSVVGADDVATLVQCVEESSEYMMNESHWLLSHFQSGLSPRDAIDLLGVLLPLVQQEPVVTLNDKPTKISAQYAWLGQWFPELLERAIAATELQDQECQQLSVAWAWLEEFCHCNTRWTSLPDGFSTKTERHSELRRSYFWLKVFEFRARCKNEPRWAFQFLDAHGVEHFSPSTVDTEWLLREIATRPDTADRELALQICFDIYLQEGRSRLILRQLRNEASDSVALQSVLRSRLRQSRFPTVKHIWHELVKQKLFNRYWRASQRRKLTAWRKSKRDSRWLSRNVRRLSDGSRPDALAILAQEAQTESDSMRLAPATWDELRRKQGRRIADAVAAGCRLIWQEYTPELPHEKESLRRIDNRLIAGLAGLSTEITSGNIDLARLSRESIQRAVRYASGEWNGFPSWFPVLVEHHREVVREVLREAIAGEWNWPEEHVLSGVLHNVRWSDERMRALVANDIVDLLEKAQPDSPAILRLVLQCLADASIDVLYQLTRICSRTLDGIATQAPEFMHWITAEIQLDVKRALDRLDRLSVDCEEDTELVVAIVAELSGEDLNARSRQYQNASAALPWQLKRLLLFCHRFIKPEDDIDRRRRGTYSPTSRDYAQRFRDSLVSQIANSESADAPAVLTALLEEPLPQRHADYIVELIARRRRSDCALPPWKERDVAEFSERFETAPKSGEELFIIIRRRLVDLRYQVEASDNSRREELRAGDDEQVFRRWLARKLDESSRGRYRIPQEVEIDLAQRPDLRVEYPELPPVPIEVKWAERWSYNELVERLQNQLVGQYLRARENQYGIYLLGYIDKEAKRSWKKNSSESLTFENLIVDIQQVADGLVESDATICGVTVVGIDFREPK